MVTSKKKHRSLSGQPCQLCFRQEGETWLGCVWRQLAWQWPWHPHGLTYRHYSTWGLTTPWSNISIESNHPNWPWSKSIGVLSSHVDPIQVFPNPSLYVIIVITLAWHQLPQMTPPVSIDLIRHPIKADRNAYQGALTPCSGSIPHSTPTAMSDATRSTILLPASRHIM